MISARPSAHEPDAPHPASRASARSGRPRPGPAPPSPGGARRRHGQADRPGVQFRLRLLLLPGEDQPVPGRASATGWATGFSRPTSRAFIAASPGPVVTSSGTVASRPSPGSPSTPRRWRCRTPPARGLDVCVNNLQTNGTLLDDAWCAFLAEHRFAVGLSIDGPARLHDRSRPDRRGRPTHDRAMRGLRTAARPRHRARRALHPQRAERRATRPRSTASSSTRRSAGSSSCRSWSRAPRWRCHRAVGRAGGDGELPLHRSSTSGSATTSVGSAVQNFAEALLVVSGQARQPLRRSSETCGRVLAVEHDGGVYSCDHFVDPAHRSATSRATASARWSGCGAARLRRGQARRPAGVCRACPVRVPLQRRMPQGPLRIAPDGEPGLNYLCEGYRVSFEHMLPHLERMVRPGPVRARGGRDHGSARGRGARLSGSAGEPPRATIPARAAAVGSTSTAAWRPGGGERTGPRPGRRRDRRGAPSPRFPGAGGAGEGVPEK